MQVIIMGQVVETEYSVEAIRNDDGKLQYRPKLKQADTILEWREIPGLAKIKKSSLLGFTGYFDRGSEIFLSQKEVTRVIESIYRADLGELHVHTTKVIEVHEVDKSAAETAYAVVVKEYNKQEIEGSNRLKAYCDLHKLDYEDTDVRELRAVVDKNERMDDTMSDLTCNFFTGGARGVR